MPYVEYACEGRLLFRTETTEDVHPHVLGSFLPTALRTFLLTLAVVDDIGAIVVIAVAYTSDLSLPWLIGAIGILTLVALGGGIYAIHKAGNYHCFLHGKLINNFLDCQSAVTGDLSGADDGYHPFV